MKQTFIAISALALSACTYAQSPAVKYAKLISAQDARRHLTVLASDAFEGRETGKPGATKAANYIAAEFNKLGLLAPVKGSYFLNIPLLESVIQVQAFSINGSAYANRKDFYITDYKPLTTIQKDLKVSEVIFIGHKTGGDAATELGNTDITGKAVFLVNEGETTANVTKRIAFIQSKKPLFILSTASNVPANLKRLDRNPNPGLQMSIKPENAPELLAPVFNITADVAAQLLINTGETYETFKASGDDTGMQANQVIKTAIAIKVNATVNSASAADVLGYMPGTDLKSEVLVFSAHYDHIGLNLHGPDKVNNGADDDGSGTTGILEIARAFARAKKDGHRPRRSILFLGNVGEEKGLLGSEYYTDHPVFPLSNTIADLNIDMIGRIGYDYAGKPDSANYVYAIGSAMLSNDLHQINETANSQHTKLVLDYKYDDPDDPNRFYYRSDHYNFAKHGVPIIFYFNGVHADYHKPGDEVGKINFPLLAKRAKLVFYTGWELANRDKRPVVDVK